MVEADRSGRADLLTRIRGTHEGLHRHAVGKLAGMIHFHGATALLVILALTVLPVTLAARFADAQRPGLVFSAIAVVLGGIASWCVVHAMGATLAGFALAWLATCAIYAVVLRVSFPGAMGVAILAFSLQVIIAVGVVSYGMHLQGITP